MRKITILPTIFLLIISISCNNNADSGNGGGWSSADKRKGLRECMSEIEDKIDETTAKKLCDCVLQKTMKKYKSYEAAENATEEEGMAMAQSCMSVIQGGGGGDFEDEDDLGNFNKKKKQDDFEDDNFDEGFDDDFGNERGRSRWTSQERRSYIQGCAQARRQAAGVSAREANSYCECMTEKIEQRYSFREANRITAQDLQTREWQNAIAECSGGGGGFDDNDEDF